MATKYYCENLSIKRDNETVTFGWSLPSGQNPQKTGTLQYKLVTDGKAAKKVKWVSVKLTGTELCPTSATITLNPALYYPATEVRLDSIEWQVKTKGGTYQAGPSFTFDTPEKPQLEVDGDMFIWASAQDFYQNSIYFQDVEYQTTNSASETEPDWTASSVETGTGTSSGSQSYTSDVDGYRWFRVRVRGVHGPSEWATGHKSHSAPYTASEVSGTLNGNILSVSFKASSKVEEAKVYYAIETPGAGYSCPSGATWEQLATSAQVSMSDTNTISGVLPDLPGADEALWVRVDLVNTTTATGNIVRVSEGDLTAPTINSFEPDTENKQITITFTNNSTVPGVYVAAVRSDRTPLKTVDAATGTITFDYENYNNANFGLFVYYGSVTSPTAQSVIVWQATDPTLPVKPSNVSVEKKEGTGKVQVSWETGWSLAEATEITWSDDMDAWGSNKQPESYTVRGTDATSWLITGLAQGKKWYFRVRSINETEEIEGPWSDTIPVNLSETPDAPAVWAENAVIAPGGSIELGWAYVTRDSTPQKAAYIYVDNDPEIAQTVEGSAQSVSFTPDWVTGTSHTIKIRTLSESGNLSDYSDSVTVTVANALSITVSTNPNLSNGQLLYMPLSVSAAGAGDGGTTSVTIKRYGSFVATRPDGEASDGFDGETIYTGSFTGEVSNLSITPDDLTGRLDDKCRYVLICAVSDSLGQTATSETVFTVAWTRQPEVPEATVTVDEENGIAVITVDEPDGYEAGDYCDIYRLSKDKPELIISGGSFDTEYVDPFPASGGGYRCVNVTSNGDYIGEAFNAWVDVSHEMKINEVVIDFDGDQQVRLPYNIDLGSKWKKDFERTVYLNGSVQGDWNKGITRDVTVNTVVLKADDERIRIMRQLADYAGICHVRTPEGSSYAADIQISESGSYGSELVSYDLTVSKVQPQGYDGMTLADWQDDQEEG